MRKKIPITYTKERVVLSDVLPYETPVTFSNRYFYKYLLKSLKSESNQKYKGKHNKAQSEIESILFGVKNKTKPFHFNITYKQNDFRELSIIHTVSQRKMVAFYEKYKNLIIYYSSLSPFSIRKPSKVANFTFYNDILHKRNEDKDLQHSQIEQDDNEYENLKSFFTYRKYSNIHKFYESYQFHRSEKKYNKLLKIDVTKCFDSIYTHTLPWALLNKNIVKTNINSLESTFGGEFDILMQDLNANETNGIIIGPEFSRIFAELILQQIDIDIFEKLKENDIDGKKLIHKVDYEIFRYVDDFFIFYNKDSDIERIKETFKLSLKAYKMYLNDKKSILYYKPIITEISIAKQKINDLFNNHLILKEKDNIIESEVAEPILYFSSNNVITRFKSIIKESEIEYIDVMNYTLAVLDNKIEGLIKKYKKFDNETSIKIQKEFEKGFLEILDVTFFLYSVSPKVNSTIKVCLIIDKITSFLKKNKTNKYTEPFTANNKHNILKKISDEINLILHKNKSKKETQIETLYLLIALSQLGREYRLNIKVLCSYFNITLEKNSTIQFNSELNYFSITVLLFYIKNKKIYQPILVELKNIILEKFKNGKINGWKDDTELVLLFFDILSCPYLEIKLDRIEKNELTANIKEVYEKLITRAFNLDDYLNSLKKSIDKFADYKPLKKIDKNLYHSLLKNFRKYSEELTKDEKSNTSIYQCEENLVTSILNFKTGFEKKVDKNAYKIKLLKELDIKGNKKILIEQEKFWFTKWTDFDFGLELQAKRSQEVY
ncbi:antiviral reverse transcriptase Drt3b [Polaribacter porphyrae]|uniref:Reverse transcriptase n=1 Tax=Polaribacter porphyrae TaxID=1137780 RepID=A0A2S7WMM5_9FLAO|nr:antiviral reverse transcriptase Drt3b [Polaribacter porphyrae]PQJ78833.1 reverse transcriptase [Polaribacter porphyrae]